MDLFQAPSKELAKLGFDVVRRTLNSSGMRAASLQLEVTESLAAKVDSVQVRWGKLQLRGGRRECPSDCIVDKRQCEYIEVHFSEPVVRERLFMAATRLASVSSIGQLTVASPTAKP